MRNIILGFVLVLMFGSVGFSQGYWHSYTPAVDTCDNAETITFAWDRDFKRSGAIQVHAVIDSLSGATAGFFYIDVCLDRFDTQWYTVSTTAMNGVQTVVSYEDTDFNATRIRCRAVGSGTMSAKVQPVIAFKRKQ